MRLIRILSLLVILAVIPIAAAQEDCPAIVKAALEAADANCAGLGRNQVCYGNIQLKATPRSGASLVFDKAGDTANVADLQMLQLSSLNLADQSWGVSLMRIQANLPDTLPGQNVTFLLFGNVSITDANDVLVELPVTATGAVNVRVRPNARASVMKALKKGQEITATGVLPDSSWVRVRLDDQSVGWVSAQYLDGDLRPLLTIQPDAPAFGPMQAFTFHTGLNDRPCQQAPDSGILIQTPKGLGTIELRANNVTIKLGSTVYLQAAPGSAMSVNVIEGHAVLTANGESQVVPAGTVSVVPLDTNGAASGPPAYPVTYDSAALQNLPLNIALPLPVPVAAGIPAVDIPAAIDIVDGLPPDGGHWTYIETTTHVPPVACGLGTAFGTTETLDTTIAFNPDRSTATFGGILHETHGVGQRAPLVLYRSGESTYAASYFSGNWQITFDSPTHFSGQTIGWAANPECSWDRSYVGTYQP